VPTVRLRNVNPLGAVELPLIGRDGDNPLQAGEEFDCDAELAGRAPGTWREPTDAERADNLAGLIAREVGEAPHVRTEVLCPGGGRPALGATSELVNTTGAPPPATGQEK